MREIKFRAWVPHDSLYGKAGMRDVNGVFLYPEHGGGEAFYAQEDGQPHISDYFEDIVLMQYTGLKDKNGVKIFEGDIVAFVYPGMAAFKTVASYSIPDGAFVFDSVLTQGMAPARFQYPSLREYCEVIGNIHEHSHLLEQDR